MNWHIIQTLLRTVLKAGAGALIARGILQSEEAEQLIGAIVLIAGIIWGIWQRTKTPPAPKVSLLFAVPLLFVATAGCASYQHSRPILLSGGVVGYESTGVRSFLMMGKASNISSTTKDKDYSRALKVGAVEGQSDAEMVRTLIEAGGTAAAAGAKAAIRVP